MQSLKAGSMAPVRGLPVLRTTRRVAVAGRPQTAVVVRNSAVAPTPNSNEVSITCNTQGGFALLQPGW
jgi:hypothetical protein